tara:strand:- start:3528 stop:4055 length:528 start_codon:yes stop_codon:yes gene_type:complete
MKRNKNKGILFWITGLSGSGKTQIAKKIHLTISKKYGPTICFSGDEIRKIFNLKGYNKRDRQVIGIKYINLAKLITDQKINVIFAVAGLLHKSHSINRATFKNYLEIFVKSEIKRLKKRKSKYFYRKKVKNVWGLDIKPEFPKKPHIIIINDFKKNINDLSKELFTKIKKKLNEY